MDVNDPILQHLAASRTIFSYRPEVSAICDYLSRA